MVILANIPGTESIDYYCTASNQFHHCIFAALYTERIISETNSFL